MAHRVPAAWLMQNAGPAIRLRLATEVFPGLLPASDIDSLRVVLEEHSAVRQLVKKQKPTGVWGGNLLGTSPNKTAGIKDVGTIPQFRRLLELGSGGEHRAVRLGTRILFRVVSRDPDPKLLFEYEKYGHAELGTEPWIRMVLREAAAAALAQAGHGDDPRVRGAAHKILNEVSTFLRGDVAQQPLVRSGRSWILQPGAYPPTVFSVSLLALLPAVQRERAGLVERLGTYIAAQGPKKTYTVAAGKKQLKSPFVVLGDPLHANAAGQTADLPFALYWMETLARFGALQHSGSAARIWARLVRECDDGGVWRPKNLRTVPRNSAPWSYHMFPIETDTKRTESRMTDVTFRMALIARLAGWELSQT